MRADDDVTYVAFRVRLTTPNGVVAEGECVVAGGHIDLDGARCTFIEMVRSGADRWEFASAEAS